MKLSMLLLVPVVITIFIVSLVPMPSYDTSRQVNVSLAMRVDTSGTPDIRIASNYTKPGYWTHVNTFWTGNVKENQPPLNYSWKLEIMKFKNKKSTDESEWTAYYYWAYSLKGAYWFNATYSFEGKVGDFYTFVVRLHYEIPMGSGDVQGVYGIDNLMVGE